ncbi:ATP-binding protein [Rhodoferax sp.]|uniref:ATP-binding protein n=1 Tax=Rhodoferax sp. TaxID=50421 RepID=UPI002763A6A8|nr:BTAD domain-containing putative transcriptional regulator [Rhodoferax sp.]
MTAPVTAPQLRLIGRAVCLHGADQLLELEHKDALLLAYLAIEGPTPRQTLAALLWPEVDAQRARANLRQRLFRLRRALGFDLLQGAVVASLDPQVQVDLNGPDDGAGELLSMLSEADAGDLIAWLASARQLRRAQRMESLAAIAEQLERAGQLGPALAAAQQLLDCDARSERAHRHLMRLHYLRGDRSAALLAFDHCEQVLKNEVGARPSPETLALLRTIEQAQPHPWVSGQPLPASVLRPPRMIGRETEAAAVGHAWSTAQVFVVSGDTGVGKSRLLATLFDARADVLVLGARPGDATVPLATLVRLAQALAERWPTTLASAAYAQLLQQANGSGPDSQAVQSVVKLGGEMLRVAHGCGLTGVVLDDLQFADDASIDSWLEWLDLPGLNPLRFGFASRVEGGMAQGRLERLRQRANTMMLTVPLFGAAQTRLLVESLDLAGTDVTAVCAALVQRIGGNPLHLLETIRSALEEHGQLLAERLDTPAQVLDLLNRRLCALPADCLLLVRIAAVAGSDFSAELAQAVSQRDLLELADAWIALERQGILDLRGFAHDLMLEAALRMLPQPIKRVIHRRVADYIVSRGAPPARLALHWLQAGDPVAALPHLVASAKLAWRAGRGRETRDAFFQAAEIEVGRGQPDAAFALLFECVEAVGRLCPTVVFDEVIARLVPLARTASHQARIALVKANSCYLHGDLPGSDCGIDDALLQAIACGDRMVEAECLFDRGGKALGQGRLRDAVEHLSACAALHRSVGLERLALAADAGKFAALRALGQVRAVLQEQQRSMPWLTENGSPVDRATTRMEQVLSQVDLGDARSADAGEQAAWQGIRDTDMHGLDLVRNALYMMRIHRLRGRWDRAIEVDSEVAHRLAEQGWETGELARERAALYLDLGRPELARPYLEVFESDPAYQEPGSWHAVAMRWRYQGAIGAPVEPLLELETVLHSQRFPKVCELVLAAGQDCPGQLSAGHLTPLLAGCEALGLQVYLLPLRALQAWLLVRDGDFEAAGTSAKVTQATLADADLGAALPGCGLWLAKTLQCLGRPRDAAAVAQHASDWIRWRLAEAVPAEFHDSFQSRNPVNRELLMLSQRLRG